MLFYLLYQKKKFCIFFFSIFYASNLIYYNQIKMECIFYENLSKANDVNDP